MTKVYQIACGLAVVALLAGAGVYFWRVQFNIAGRVTYNGVVLDKPGGKVVFVAPDGTQTAAPIGPDGAYRAVYVPAGLNRVAVYYPDQTVRNLKGRTKAGEPPPPPLKPFLTPSNYASVETSGIEIEVDYDRDFDIELVGPPIP